MRGQQHMQRTTMMLQKKRDWREEERRCACHACFRGACRVRHNTLLLIGCLYLQLVNGHPAICRDVLHVRYQPLHASVPVGKQNHEAYQVEYTHELARILYELKQQTNTSTLLQLLMLLLLLKLHGQYSQILGSPA